MRERIGKLPYGLRLYGRKLWLATMLGVSIINALDELRRVKELNTETNNYRKLQKLQREVAGRRGQGRKA